MSDPAPTPPHLEMPEGPKEEQQRPHHDVQPPPGHQARRQPPPSEQEHHHDLQQQPSHQHQKQPSIVEEEVDGEEGEAPASSSSAAAEYCDEKGAGRTPSDACTENISHDGGETRQSVAINERIEAHRVQDELEMLRAERKVSFDENIEARSRVRMHNPEPEDAFNTGNSVSIHEKKKNEDAALYKLWVYLRKFPRFVRYVLYLLPGAILLLAPVLYGRDKHRKHHHVGPRGVQLLWFGVWLEIIWCSLWVSRMVAYLMPPMIEGIAKAVGSCSAHKWREMGQRLELHLALLLWTIAVFVSFEPLMNDHPDHEDDDGTEPKRLNWVDNTNKTLIAILVLGASNFVEKILIHWITTTFHQRTYADRIQKSKKDVELLVQLFAFARSRRPENGSDFWTDSPSRHLNGTSTPMQVIHHNARQVLGKVGHVAGKVGNDLIGRKYKTDKPRKIVRELLGNEKSARSLARQIYRCIVRDGQDMIHSDDMQAAFSTVEEAEAAFTTFDKDLNGDVSLEELETACDEIQREQKSLISSLRDLDSVTSKLDRVFLFVIVVVAVIVFVCIVSKAGAAGITSAGTSILGLAWMLQATAQEFLQSIIFVFIKHPFDVGDRVTVYGSTGASLTGDDYYVAEISLLYTEFRKLQGHIVQAPNSLLNTLFILNQRRSLFLTDSIPLQMRFGTPAEKIEELKARMLEFVKANKRDYQPKIITELTAFDQVRSCTMNFVFFHKSNFQNELQRLRRHNNFTTELMRQMVLVGIESPLRSDPGGSNEHPMHWTASLPPPSHQARPREPPPQPAAPSVVPSAPNRPNRAFSVRSGLGTLDDELTAGSFQDVFEHRREQVNLRRMESIRERERGSRPEEQGVHPTNSVRSRFFGRARSRTVSSAQNDVV